jgi:hypothetical protein
MYTFYDTQKLSFDQKTALLNDCKEICFRWFVDKLDCNESFARKGIEMSFEDIMKMFDDSNHFVVIDRGRYGLDNRHHFEIGFCTNGNITYFLFILVEKEKMPAIIEKYELKPMTT